MFCLSPIVFAQAAPLKSDLVFHDEERIGALIAQRWTAKGEEVPEYRLKHHIYEHLVVIYNDKPVLTLSALNTNNTSWFEIREQSGHDINNDGTPDLIVEAHSAGAQCCSTTTIYSITDKATAYWQQSTGECPVTVEDMNRDGNLELVTCDDVFVRDFCTDDVLPMPPVVYRYDVIRRTFIPDTPAFAGQFSEKLKRHLAEAEQLVGSPTVDPDVDLNCIMLLPVADTIYLTGKIELGIELLQRLDKDDSNERQIEAAIVQKVKSSPHFATR
jgi:hypothetical protein